MTDTINNAAQSNGHDKAPQEPQFITQSIYIKDCSVESPRAPHIFRETWEPTVEFDLQMNTSLLSQEEGAHEVVLNITVTVKLKETIAFLVEIKQAGIFTLQGYVPEIVKEILGTACPTILFPYAREAISSLIQRAGFPQFILPPINFDAMYAQHLASQENKAGQSEVANA